MSDRYTRITVPLSKDEFEALRDTAQGQYRHPREQARFILRQVLLGNSKTAVNTWEVCETEQVRSGFAGVVNS